jgi:hypothetical protein
MDNPQKIRTFETFAEGKNDSKTTSKAQEN